MELLETNDPKSVLLKKSAKHRKGIEDEIKVLSENTEKMITNVLIIGGTLALTYLLISQYSKSKKSKGKFKGKKIKLTKENDADAEEADSGDDSEVSIVSRIGSAVAAQATVFLLSLAKDKLSAYLKTSFNKDAGTTNEHS